MNFAISTICFEVMMTKPTILGALDYLHLGLVSQAGFFRLRFWKGTMGETNLSLSHHSE